MRCCLYDNLRSFEPLVSVSFYNLCFIWQSSLRKCKGKPKTNMIDTNHCVNKKHPIHPHLSSRGSPFLASSLHDLSSSGSTEGTRVTPSMIMNTKEVKKRDTIPYPPRPGGPLPYPPRPHSLIGDRYNQAWESLSASYHPKQEEYDKAISTLTHGKKPKRKNIFQLGRADKSMSSSRKILAGIGSSGSSSENAPISNNYRSLLSSSSYANIRKEPRPSSAHGHLGVSGGHHHGVSKIRRNTDSGTESGGSSGSSTRDYGGRGRERTDNEEVTIVFGIIITFI